MIDSILGASWLPGIPGFVYKTCIDRQIKRRLKNETSLFENSQGENKQLLIQSLRESPIALSTGADNTQHYEVPTEFYKRILGPHLKYSACSFDKAEDLASAEKDMLEIYCQRAKLADGQQILDLGCGWGSFTLYAAQRFPNSQFVGLSNSATQKKHIEQEALRLNLDNISIITADVNEHQFKNPFDRIISVEMFEHVRNYDRLMNKIVSVRRTYL